MSRFRTLTSLPDFFRTFGLIYRYLLFAAFGALPAVFLCYSVSAQNQPPSDPQAVTYATQSIAAMTGSITISDVTLSGTVTWNGSATPESGTATLMALGTAESSMNLVLPDGTRKEIRDAQTGIALGQWTNPNNASSMFAYQNCQSDAVWFFPVLGSSAGGPNVVLSYIGQTSRNGTTVQQIQSYVYQSNSSGTTPTPQQLSTMNFYLDATTLLPGAVTFNAHPDNNANTNMPIEIDFSNYQALNGVRVPTLIQKYSQGSQLVAVTVTVASFNAGLPLSDFTINQ
jgi:hypothetical protein